MTFCTRFLADSRKIPVGSPWASRSMAPPAGGNRFARDSGSGQSSRVGDGNVAVDAVQQGWMIARHPVEFLAGRQRFLCPQSVVPVAADEPVVSRSVFGKRFDPGQHFGQGLDARQVHIELGAAGIAKMHMGVVKSRKNIRARGGGIQVAEARLRPGQPGDLLVCADGQHFAASDSHGLHNLRLAHGHSHARIENPVEENNLGHGNVGGCGPDAAGRSMAGWSRLGETQRRNRETCREQSRKGAHGRSVTKLPLRLALLVGSPLQHGQCQQQHPPQPYFAVLIGIPLALGMRAAALAARPQRNGLNAER